MLVWLKSKGTQDMYTSWHWKHQSRSTIQMATNWLRGHKVWYQTWDITLLWRGTEGQWVGSAGEGDCCQSWRLEFDSQCLDEEELTPENCDPPLCVMVCTTPKINNMGYNLKWKEKGVTDGTTRMGRENMLSERTNQIHTETCLARDTQKYTQKDSRVFGYQETHSVSYSGG